MVVLNSLVDMIVYSLECRGIFNALNAVHVGLSKTKVTRVIIESRPQCHQYLVEKTVQTVQI